VPDDLHSLLALPGIGTYTARAVAAFAFRQRHPVVDTNVRRLIARAVEGRPEAGAATTAADLAAVERLLPPDSEAAATASVAFMELGALVCTARTPRCEACPFLDTCAARAASGSSDRLAPGAWAPNVADGTGTSRRAPRYLGSDRQVRGLLLAALRGASGPVPVQRLALVWPEPVQRSRALAGLVADGLARRVGELHYALPD
jgi:A/G-specific adenine glycosylase